jgi:hypothetical protein
MSTPGALLVLTAGVLLLAGWLAIRASGAHVSMARRLGGAAQLRVGEVLDAVAADRLPLRPVRVAGRIRCSDPLRFDEDARLVAYHRDVEVQLPDGRWQTIERVRETRSFELWDHDGSLGLDPAQAAEPLVVIPGRWQGRADELGTEYAAALQRITAEHGPPGASRATTRTLSVVERLLVLAEVGRAPDGSAALIPPRGGFVITGLELDEAMRLLGGPRRRWLIAGSAAMVVGIVAAALGIAALLGTMVN